MDRQIGQPGERLTDKYNALLCANRLEFTLLMSKLFCWETEHSFPNPFYTGDVGFNLQRLSNDNI